MIAIWICYKKNEIGVLNLAKKKQLKLGAFLMLPGHHVSAWRHESTKKEDLLSFKFIKEQAKIAEQGKFDTVFLADHPSLGAYNSPGFENNVHVRFEPFTLLAALSSVTEKIGLVGTVSTSHNEPYNVARLFASLDQLSEGRVAWNVVTSESTKDFGNGQPLTHGKRYERAEEFVDVLKKLWNSWEDDALVYDQESGRATDASKVHPINHEGEWFSVQGPLSISGSQQGHSVIVQAGSSESGKELAARTAEVVFTAWQTLEEAQDFYKDLKGRLAKYGRQPDELKVMPGVFPIVGRTEEEAYAKRQHLLDLIPVEAGVARLSAQIGFDLSGYPVDGPLPELPDIEEINTIKSRPQLIRDLAERENLTIRQLYQRISGGRGHREIIGTPEQIADQLQEWFENDAADGFNILPPFFPDGLNDFVDLVIPELQKRGIFRTEYEGSTLRENLGLEKPVNSFAKVALEVR